jgi:tRNA nucleotidyltransferase (CCA-adding enzyme)
MEIPPATELIERVRALPAGGPLLDHLGERADVHLVGGAVRDLLLGGAPTDLDLVVEGDASEPAQRLGGRLVRYERFGTSTVELDGFSYDIAQARRESYSAPGALPDVEPAPLEEDLLRRDFTVNAIALSLGQPHPGALTAPRDALGDLDRRLLRVLHDHSFLDDPTRLLRLARYRSRLSFEIEPVTARLAAAAIAAGALATVSGSRLGAELRLLAREPDPLKALQALDQLGLAAAIHPEFGPPDIELGRRALALLPDSERSDRLALAVAMRAIQGDELRRLLDQLAFEAEDREVILAAVTRSRHVAEGLARAQRPSQILETVDGAALELVALAGGLGPREAAESWISCLRHVRLEIDGSDLLAAGVPEGPAIGRGLRAALQARLDGRAEGREAQLEVARQAAQATG